MSEQTLNPNPEILNKSEFQNSRYDLKERTLEFAKNYRRIVKKLPKSVTNTEHGKQLVRSSGSVGANYIEAKESRYWLRLFQEGGNNFDELIAEAAVLMKMFGAILEESK